MGTHTGGPTSYWVEDSSMGTHTGPTSHWVEDSSTRTQSGGPTSHWVSILVGPNVLHCILGPAFLSSPVEGSGGKWTRNQFHTCHHRY